MTLPGSDGRLLLLCLARAGMLLTVGKLLLIYSVRLAKNSIYPVMLQECGPEGEQMDPDDHTAYCSKVILQPHMTA